MSILDSMIEIKDLFHYWLQYLSYDDFVNLSCVQKSFHQAIKIYKSQEIFQNIFQEKFERYEPLILSLAPYDQYLFLWDNKKVFPIHKYFRDLFINKSAHVSDILQFFSQIFLIDESQIYSTYYMNEYFIPKKIIQKYGLKRYEKYPMFSAYVPIELNHFDWNKIQITPLDSILYIKIWNIELKMDIIIYLFHQDSDILPEIDWIIQESKSKIQQIINYHRYQYMTYEQDPFFMNKGELRIFTINKHTYQNNLIGWFLE